MLKIVSKIFGFDKKLKELRAIISSERVDKIHFENLSKELQRELIKVRAELSKLQAAKKKTPNKKGK